MKNNLLRQLIMLSKLTFYGIFLQCLFAGMIIAGSLEAQKIRTVHDVLVQVDGKESKISDLFRLIELNSEFQFTYYHGDFDINQTIKTQRKEQSVSDLLLQISKEAALSFRQVNNNINVKRIDVKKAEKPLEIIIQGVTISGRVTSEEDLGGLPGVNVVVKGTTLGTVTDIEGNYTLEVPDENSVLVFSSVGFLKEEVVVGSKAVIDISLVPDITALEEIVVIGYGTASKSDLTGAVSTMGGSDIQERKTIQLSRALQGAMSGVMVTRNNNSPGSSANIRIRGITTIGDSNPLILVDGVPVDNIDDVHSNDVESISVLKDAASAAIYGSRAASGVILITTKRAKTNELTLGYSFEYGIEKPTTLPDYVDVYRYMEIANESDWNDSGNPANEYPVYAKDIIDNYASLHQQDPDRYPLTDWSGIMFNKNAPRQSHLINVAAGTGKIRSKASIGYDNIDGLYDGKTFERYTARFNNDIEINDFIDVSIDFSYFHKLTENPFKPSADIIRYGRMSPPLYAATWQDGRIAEGKAGDNIYGETFFGGYKNGATNLFTGNAAINIKPVKGLKLSAIFSPQFQNYKGKDFKKQVEVYSADDPTIFERYLDGFETTSLQESRSDYKRFTTQLLANYQASLNNHNINVMGGFENFYAYNESMGASRDQYPFSSFPYLDVGPLEYRDNYGGAYENALRSFFGRMMYNYGNKYYLQGNIRFDGSSRFHSDYRWGFFPSVSAGWVLTEESFMEKSGLLSYLKLRGTWGRLGNERIGNYPYQATMSFANALFMRGNNVVSGITAAQREFAIPDITWESTETYGVGFDAFLFDSRLSFTGDWYKKTTIDMLLELEIPDFIGYDNPNQNTGKMYTNGWEFDVAWSDNIGELDYSVSFNLSDFRSEMGNLGGIEFLGSQVKMEGSEFNEWYGYVSDGIYQTQEEVDGSATTGQNVAPGDIKYLDISGPEGIPDGTISPEYDRVLLGGSLPRFLYGSNIRMNYKGFDLSFVFQGVGKQNSIQSTDMVKPLDGRWLNTPANIEGKYWSMYNSEEQNQRAEFPRISYVGAGNNYAMSDYWMFNGRYFRLKNITLGYTFSNTIMEKLQLRDLRIYANLSDVFTLSKYPKGWDPEVAATGYPITTSFIGGISIKF